MNIKTVGGYTCDGYTYNGMNWLLNWFYRLTDLLQGEQFVNLTVYVE